MAEIQIGSKQSNVAMNGVGMKNNISRALDTIRALQRQHALAKRTLQSEQFKRIGDQIEEMTRVLQNIEIHFEQLCTEDLCAHGFISEEHDLDFKVFRVLCGYAEALEENAALRAAAEHAIVEIPE